MFFLLRSTVIQNRYLSFPIVDDSSEKISHLQCHYISDRAKIPIKSAIECDLYGAASGAPIPGFAAIEPRLYVVSRMSLLGWARHDGGLDPGCDKTDGDERNSWGSPSGMVFAGALKGLENGVA